MLTAVTNNFQISLAYSTSFPPASQWSDVGWQDAGRVFHSSGSNPPLGLPATQWILLPLGTNELGGIAQKT